MTPRERVLAAFVFKESDRVPIDFSGHRSSGIAATLYPRLRAHLGLPRQPVRVYDPIQQMAVVDEDVLDLLGVDTVELGRGFAQADEQWHDWVLPDQTPCRLPVWIRPEREEKRWVLRSESGRVIAQMADGSFYFEQTHYPIALRDDLDRLSEAMAECMWTAVASPPGPLASTPEVLREGALRLRQETDRAILGLFGGNLLEMGQFLYGNGRFLQLLAEEPRRAHGFLERVTEMHLAKLEEFLGAVKGCIDIIVFGDDLGMQTGPQISPAMYREFFKPRHGAMWARAKELAGVRVMLHCCGGVRQLLPDLIAAGLEAINPVQIGARGMDAAELKAEFGGEIVFWGGGCDTQRVLPLATPEEVREHVRSQVEILRRGGGFVFQQVHNILAHVPVENVAAMFSALRE